MTSNRFLLVRICIWHKLDQYNFMLELLQKPNKNIKWIKKGGPVLYLQFKYLETFRLFYIWGHYIPNFWFWKWFGDKALVPRYTECFQQYVKVLLVRKLCRLAVLVKLFKIVTNLWVLTTFQLSIVASLYAG